MKIHTTQQGNISMCWFDSLSLTVVRRTVDNDEWREMLAIAKRESLPLSRVSLVWMHDADVTAEQRRMTNELEKETTRSPLLALAVERAKAKLIEMNV